VFANALIVAGLAIAAHPLFTLAAFLGRRRRDRLGAAAGAALLGALVAMVVAAGPGRWAGTRWPHLLRPADVIIPPLAQMAAAVQSGGTLFVLFFEG